MRTGCFWGVVVFLSYAFASSGAPRADSGQQSLRAFARDSVHRQAYGVYIGGAKAGWAIDELRLGRYQNQEVAIESFEMQVVTAMAGVKVDALNRAELYYSLTGPGEIVYGEDNQSEEGKQTRITAVRQGDRMLVTIQSPTQTSKRTVGLPKENLSQLQKLDRWLVQTPRPGSQFTNYTTTWDRDDIDVREVLSYKKSHSILWGGLRTKVHVVDMESEGAVIQCEIASDGTLIKGVIGGFMELRAEKEAIARNLKNLEPIDMLAASAIPVDKQLGPPERVTRLILEMEGLGKFVIPLSHRQQVSSRRGAASVLELRKDFRRPGPPEPLASDERDRYLQATTAIQSEHEKIRRLAREITSNETDPVKISDQLQHWVHRNLRQTIGANSATAVDILETRAGDCTEHALLFVALARAARIPAREVGGIMYGSEDRPLFGWHAWAEIHDGHQWVSVDPTWEELYVDATHIKLAEGADDWAWLNLLGKLKVRVLEFETRK